MKALKQHRAEQVLKEHRAEQVLKEHRAEQVLKEHRAEQAAERLAAGSAWNNPYGLVLTTHIGTAIEPENL
ncbi:hypothetical protein [Microbispora bryophytorum]|uniref:Uncharacterized protein n=1 Tax=Microbispora bryophytorum TaxID=1460882 RepID=A0A8H9LDV7_9ACTN|nr:hypothetical protein [Microbispora bryophytorum]MBD3139831.1 hypothetical protein [Microbispora bryophytorum]GGO27090.1 hypothetical protein GCM10011574_60150 [Microbispora bryophytorum]